MENFERRLKVVENALSDWQDWKYITRDSSHKIGLAQGLSVSLQNEVLEMKVSLAHVARTIDDVLQRQIDVQEKIERLEENIEKNFDTVIRLLSPNREV
jgi:phage shock protein A